MTGLGMINAGVTTQLLLSLFEVTGVVHYGIAGNANPALHIGDVAIPQYWAHTALWSWQRNGAGPEDQLPLEENGDYTREIGYIKFANYATNITNCPSNDNLLNNVWSQPEEVFFRDGVPEERDPISEKLNKINAGVTTQLLLSLFEVTGVVHYGIAGNANPALHIGDVAIPQYWAHTALWSWQRNGAGPEDQLPLEENGDYTREIGYIKFANYATNITNCPSNDNLLNNVWYQPEEVFFRDGVPEEREHAFWVPVDTHYFRLAKKLEGMVLEGCVNSTTCLTEKPKVTRVHRGTSASIYLDNAAYRASIFGKFNVSPVDMESAAVALICLQQRTPFIIFRALSDLAGGGSADSNEAATFISLAANNSVAVVLEFIKNLPTKRISTA